MGKKPNNKEVLNETKRANAVAEANAARNLKVVEGQLALMAGQKAPKYEAPAPGPTQSSADVVKAGLESRKRSARLYGHNQSVVPLATTTA
jgi:hypothetical protein